MERALRAPGKPPRPVMSATREEEPQPPQRRIIRSR
jgi:hypothetical protein